MHNYQKDDLCVVCVKYGNKYGADYVNKLFSMVKKHLPRQHDFICFTENPSGLDPEIEVVDLFQDKPGESHNFRKDWKLWWSKVNIFDGYNYRFKVSEEKPQISVLYIDLDMIITGDISPILDSYRGDFSTLTTNDIFCEQT